MISSKLLAVLTASALLISPTFAAESGKMLMPSGKPAGVKNAQDAEIGTGTLIWGGITVAVITAVAITVGQSNKNTVISTSTTGTGA